MLLFGEIYSENLVTLSLSLIPYYYNVLINIALGPCVKGYSTAAPLVDSSNLALGPCVKGYSTAAPLVGSGNAALGPCVKGYSTAAPLVGSRKTTH